MSTETTNLKLIKPSSNDFFNIHDFNDNTDKIDAAIAGKADKTDIPTSLPADGGNADTVGGKKPSDFPQLRGDVTTQDWNTLIDSGIYSVENFSGTNGPSDANIYKFGTLVVSHRGYAISQVYHAHNANNDIYARAGWGLSGGGWQPWKKINDGGNANSVSIPLLPAAATLASLLSTVGDGETRYFRYATGALPGDYPTKMIVDGNTFNPLVTISRIAGIIYIHISAPNSATGMPKAIDGYYNGSFYWNTMSEFVSKDEAPKDGMMIINKHGNEENYQATNLQLLAGDGRSPGISFHRAGVSASLLYEHQGRLRIRANTWGEGLDIPTIRGAYDLVVMPQAQFDAITKVPTDIYFVY